MPRWVVSGISPDAIFSEYSRCSCQTPSSDSPAVVMAAFSGCSRLAPAPSKTFQSLRSGRRWSSSKLMKLAFRPSLLSTSAELAMIAP